MAEEMTSKERFINALEMKEVDRVPYGHLWFGAGNAILERMGANLKDVYYSAKGIAKAQILARDMYHHDNVMSPWGCMLVEAEALGTKVNIKDDAYPTIAEYLLKSSGEYDKINPQDIERSERIQTVLESIGILKKEIKEDAFITGFMLPPFSLASQLTGTSTMCMDMVMGSEDLHELLQRVTEFSKLYADRMLEEGADGILFDNGGSTTDLISPEMAEEFMYKYTKEVYEHVQSNGGYVISHNCALHATYDLEIAMKPDALNFSYGEVNIIKEKHGINCAKIHAKSGCSPRYCMKELANSNVCLMGNIESSVLLDDSPTIIEQEVKNCIEAAPEKGFILSTGCEIPLSVPADKMETLWEAIKTHF